MVGTFGIHAVVKNPISFFVFHEKTGCTGPGPDIFQLPVYYHGDNVVTRGLLFPMLM